MLEEIRELGFHQVELSHGIPVTLVAGILKAVEDKVVRISSTHNFCPLPSMVTWAAPNLFQPSSKDRSETNAWLRYSIQTLEFASRVGADLVVMHSGSLSFRFRSPERAFENREEIPEQEREKAWKRITKTAEKTGPRVQSNFALLLPHAEEAGIRLGVENREGILEFPLDAGHAAFLSDLDSGNLVYWHDTGHAEIKSRLGLIDHYEHLEFLSDRLAGFHLHDVNEEGRDHQPVGTGSIDFQRIGGLVRPEHKLVLELSPRVKKEEVLTSRETILEAFSS